MSFASAKWTKSLLFGAEMKKKHLHRRNMIILRAGSNREDIWTTFFSFSRNQHIRLLWLNRALLFPLQYIRERFCGWSGLDLLKISLVPPFFSFTAILPLNYLRWNVSMYVFTQENCPRLCWQTPTLSLSRERLSETCVGDCIPATSSLTARASSHEYVEKHLRKQN